MRAVAVMALVVGCSDGANLPEVGPATELELLAPWDPARPFNHSREVTIAAHDGRVAVAAIHEHFAGADTFDPSAGYHKRVAINMSNDGGATFGAAIDPGVGDQTTDPVIRAAADGTLWLATWDTMNFADSTLARSSDGVTWTKVTTGVDYGDKEWIAIDDARAQVFIGSTRGFWRYGFDGALRAEMTATPAGMMADAYADAAGAHFAAVGHSVLRWDGTGPSVQEVAPMDAGAAATMFTTVCWSRGPVAAGGTWSVRARRDADGGSIVVRIEDGSGVVETLLTAPGAVAFYPVGALDADGRLHVAWYDSAGAMAVLRYAHSRGPAPFAAGFIDPVVVDDAAAPGQGWYPDAQSSSGLRRLREYIGLAVDGGVVHVAWTHAPIPPSRVRTVAIQPRPARPRPRRRRPQTRPSDRGW